AGDGPGMVAGAIDLPASGPYLGNDAATWRMLYPNAGGSTQPGTYLPRKIELLTVDAHSLVALAAPRPVFTNGGTHDSWTDPRGMWLTQVYATPVYNLLGRRGIVDRPWPFDPSHVPDDPVTPSTRLMRNFDGYILGHLGYRYAGEALHPELPDESPGSGGHTPNEDFPTFVQFAAKFFDDLTPPTLPALPDRDAVATDDGSAIVRFSASAIDAVDDNVPVVFTPASGSRFPVGTTTVMATATDVSGNVATTTFKVTVHDTLSAPMATPTMAVPGE
ncbi:MAG TPA: HYR domain-containing protein, partial [Polyangiaceae bacterium]|nr:HYR domain-containing protein [Polyangiaceae bacterium]